MHFLSRRPLKQKRDFRLWSSESENKILAQLLYCYHDLVKICILGWSRVLVSQMFCKELVLWGQVWSWRTGGLGQYLQRHQINDNHCSTTKNHHLFQGWTLRAYWEQQCLVRTAMMPFPAYPGFQRYELLHTMGSMCIPRVREFEIYAYSLFQYSTSMHTIPLLQIFKTMHRQRWRILHNA